MGLNSLNINKITFSSAVESAITNIVSIQTIYEVDDGVHPMFIDPIFRFFFGDSDDIKKPFQKKKMYYGLGSGVIVSDCGYVLTNNHVIKESSNIVIKFYSGYISKIKIIGYDKRTDLAVLKILDFGDISISPIIFGLFKDLKIGDIVLAIGSSLGFDNTVTQGIISSLGSISLRSNEQQISFGGLLDNLIQTDAAINPGNSGGGLFDINGRIIGITLAIISRSGGNQGIAFAIPIDLALNVMNSLIVDGRVIRGWIGIQLILLSDHMRDFLCYNDNNGVYVQGVIKNSPAHKIGILPGDIIVGINNINVFNIYQAVQIVSSLVPNDICIIDVFRKFNFLTFHVIVENVSEL